MRYPDTGKTIRKGDWVIARDAQWEHPFTIGVVGGLYLDTTDLRIVDIHYPVAIDDYTQTFIFKDFELTKIRKRDKDKHIALNLLEKL